LESSVSNIGALERTIGSMERFRTCTLSHWLKIRPPLVLTEEKREIESLLLQEEKLIKELQGAYFLVTRPTLPHYFRLVQISFSSFEEYERMLHPPDGKKLYGEVIERLNTLATEMGNKAPRYARQRLQPVAKLVDVQMAIRSHAQ